jgi:putative heme iron utilization protein
MTTKEQLIQMIEEYKKNAPIKMKRKMYFNLNKKHKLRKISKFGYRNS